MRDRNPQELRSAPLEGYVWVEVFERLEHVWLEHVEVRPGGKPDSAGC